MTASKNSSVELCLPTQSSNDNIKVLGERTDGQSRLVQNASSSAPSQNVAGVFWWCEGWQVDMEMLQEGVCGNALVESRDDVTSNNESKNETNDASGSGVIDNMIKNTTSKNETESILPSKPKQGVEEVSKSENSKVLFDPATLSTSNKVKYERFKDLIDSASSAYGSQSLPVADLYISMAIDLEDDNEEANSKELALVLYEESFNIYQAKAGDSDVRTVGCRIRLGRILHSLGMHDKALDNFCQAVYMREALLGELHPSVSDVWVLISSVHKAKNKLEPALKASAKALTGYRNAHGDKHPTVIAVLKTIAQIHTEMGNADKASDINKYVRLHKTKKSSTTSVSTKAQC